MLPTSGLNQRPPGLQSDGASKWATEAGSRMRNIKSIAYLFVIVLCGYFLYKSSWQVGFQNLHSVELFINRKEWSIYVSIDSKSE